MHCSSAALSQAAIGAGLAGRLHQASTWTTACLVLALANLSGAVLQTWALSKIAGTGQPMS